MATVAPLVQAMTRLVEMEAVALAAMADASRHLAESRFDVVGVNEQLTAVLEQSVGQLTP